jgi:hypothetical protein
MLTILKQFKALAFLLYYYFTPYLNQTTEGFITLPLTPAPINSSFMSNIPSIFSLKLLKQSNVSTHSVEGLF